MIPIDCHLSFAKNKQFINHFYQAIFGYRQLQTGGIVSLKIDFSSNQNIPYNNIFLCQVNGKKIFYDLSDGTQNFELEECRKFLQEHDAVIFKRAYDEVLYGKEPRIFPYGLNYIALYPFYMILGLKFNFFKYHWLQMSPAKEHWWSMQKAGRQYTIPILFCTRLWEKQDEINESRIMLAYKLRKYFKDAIVGISDTPLSRKLCRDLILPPQVTQRKKFIDLTNRSAVCITTTGLWRSTGWRFGEFVSAGKAIVSEPLCYKVPGDLQEGKNYLTFSSIDEALHNCETLLQDNDKRNAMEIENLNYYFQYLKPDTLIMNTLKQFFTSM